MVRGNFHCRGVPLIWFTGGFGPAILAVGAGGGACLDGFLLSILSLLISFSLGDGLVQIEIEVYLFLFTIFKEDDSCETAFSVPRVANTTYVGTEWCTRRFPTMAKLSIAAILANNS